MRVLLQKDKAFIWMDDVVRSKQVGKVPAIYRILSKSGMPVAVIIVR